MTSSTYNRSLNASSYFALTRKEKPKQNRIDLLKLLI